MRQQKDKKRNYHGFDVLKHDLATHLSDQFVRHICSLQDKVLFVVRAVIQINYKTGILRLFIIDKPLINLFFFTLLSRRQTSLHYLLQGPKLYLVTYVHTDNISHRQMKYTVYALFTYMYVNARHKPSIFIVNTITLYAWSTSA